MFTGAAAIRQSGLTAMGDSTSRDEPAQSVDTWSRMEDIISVFESAWQRGERPTIESFLIGNADERLALVGELVHIDLEYCLRHLKNELRRES